jgi:membrane-associated phospholipid phosphatase
VGKIDNAARHRVADDADVPPLLVKMLHEAGFRWILIPILAMLWAAGYKTGRPGLARGSSQSLVALVIGGALGEVVKRATGRARPQDNADPGCWDATHGKRAAPSGHAVNVLTVATALADRRGMSPITALGAAAALTIAWSRMSIEKHWASDMLAGASIGCMTARAVGWAIDVATRRQNR